MPEARKPHGGFARQDGVTLSAGSTEWGGRTAVGSTADDGRARAFDADEAVVTLFAAHYASLVRLAVLLTRDTGLAEEIVQDCFVELHQRWRGLRDPDAGAAYLRRSVVNRCRSELRHRGVVDRFLGRAGQGGAAVGLRAPRWAGDQLGREDFVPSAESLALAAGLHADVLDAVRGLPARQREALVLRYYLDLTEAQTAEVMGVSTGAVKSHTARALAALRRVLEEPES